MNFFEQELRRIAGKTHPDATFVGRACYIRLSETNRAKLQFVTCGCSDRYEALKLTVLNRQDGPVDSLFLRFGDLLGSKKVSNTFIRELTPYVWICNEEVDWYAYQPTEKDYTILRDAVDGYLGVFIEPTQHPAHQKKQTMA